MQKVSSSLKYMYLDIHLTYILLENHNTWSVHVSYFVAFELQYEQQFDIKICKHLFHYACINVIQRIYFKIERFVF